MESLLAEDAGVRSFLETPALEFVKNMSGEDSGQSMIGRRFGPYSVVSLLAKGGMGEVYRARDTELHRDAALKLLPEIFASNAERLARFERDAHVLAALKTNYRSAGSRTREGHHQSRFKTGKCEDHTRRAREGSGFRIGEASGRAASRFLQLTNV